MRAPEKHEIQGGMPACFVFDFAFACVFYEFEATHFDEFRQFWRHVGAPRVTFRDSVLKWRPQGPPEQKKNKKDTHFPLGRAPRAPPEQKKNKKDTHFP